MLRLCCDYRVEWDFWTSSNDGCGNGCNQQADFKKKMQNTAIALEKVSQHHLPCLP